MGGSDAVKHHFSLASRIRAFSYPPPCCWFSLPRQISAAAASSRRLLAAADFFAAGALIRPLGIAATDRDGLVRLPAGDLRAADRGVEADDAIHADLLALVKRNFSFRPLWRNLPLDGAIELTFDYPITTKVFVK